MAKIEVLRGVEGLALVVNDARVGGPKAWGGGTVIAEFFSVDHAEILDAIFGSEHAAFLAKAVRAAEKELRIPAGWWGTYRDVRGPGGVRVRNAGDRRWTVRIGAALVRTYETRAGAIRAAQKLVP